MEFTVEELVTAYIAYGACALSVAEDKALDPGRELFLLTEEERAEAKILRMQDGKVAWAMSDEQWQERIREQVIEREVDRDLVRGLAVAIDTVPRWTNPWKLVARALFERCDALINEMDAAKTFASMSKEAKAKVLAEAKTEPFGSQDADPGVTLGRSVPAQAPVVPHEE